MLKIEVVKTLEDNNYIEDTESEMASDVDSLEDILETGLQIATLVVGGILSIASKRNSPN